MIALGWLFRNIYHQDKSEGWLSAFQFQYKEQKLGWDIWLLRFAFTDPSFILAQVKVSLSGKSFVKVLKYEFSIGGLNVS